MSGTVSKELRPLYRKAKAAGWREEKVKAGVRLYPPNGAPPVTFHGSSVGRGAVIEQQKRHLRAGGLDV
jgi:hypothetical protein